MANIRQNWLNVLLPFANDYTAKFTASEIARITNIPQRTVSRSLDNLVIHNLIRFIIEGKNKKFHLDLNDQRIRVLTKLIEDYKALDFSIKNKKIYLMIEDLFEERDLIIFGSYAKGNYNDKSDIDILIIGNKSKKLLDLARNQPKQLNLHFSTLSGFEKLLKNRNLLALEIIKSHIIFGDSFSNLCWKFYKNEI